MRAATHFVRFQKETCKTKKIRMGKGEKGKAKCVPIIHRGSPHPGMPRFAGGLSYLRQVARNCLSACSIAGEIVFAFLVLHLSALTEIETPLPDAPLGGNRAVISKARVGGAHSREGLTTAVTLTRWRREVRCPGCSEGHRKGKACWARGGGC